MLTQLENGLAVRAIACCFAAVWMKLSSLQAQGFIAACLLLACVHPASQLGYSNPAVRAPASHEGLISGRLPSGFGIVRDRRHGTINGGRSQFSEREISRRQSFGQGWGCKVCGNSPSP